MNDINVKKTKVMVISKKGGEKCNMVINGVFSFHLFVFSITNIRK